MMRGLKLSQQNPHLDPTRDLEQWEPISMTS
jgi:hypothetical protein